MTTAGRTLPLVTSIAPQYGDNTGVEGLFLHSLSDENLYILPVVHSPMGVADTIPIVEEVLILDTPFHTPEFLKESQESPLGGDSHA